MIVVVRCISLAQYASDFFGATGRVPNYPTAVAEAVRDGQVLDYALGDTEWEAADRLITKIRFSLPPVDAMSLDK